jgi:hypothetical protein
MHDTIETTVTCPKCDAAYTLKYSRYSPEKTHTCSACGEQIPLPEITTVPLEPAPSAQMPTAYTMRSSRDPKEVIITDIRIPFGSMVVFMLKWAIASIPAALLLAGIVFLVFGTLIIGGCAAILNLAAK